MSMLTGRTAITDSLNKFHFEAPRAADETPYRLQGSQGNFDTSPIRQKRQEIRRSSKLRSAALQFWTAAKLREDQRMKHPTYVYIHRRISKALAPELTDDARLMINELMEPDISARLGCRA